MSLKKGKLNAFQFFQTEYLGGQISHKEGFYKDYSMRDADRGMALWFFKNIDRLANMSPEQVMIEILDAESKLEYLRGMTEISHLSMKIGVQQKRTDARSVKELLSRARAGINTEGSKT